MSMRKKDNAKRINYNEKSRPNGQETIQTKNGENVPK